MKIPIPISCKTKNAFAGITVTIVTLCMMALLDQDLLTQTSLNLVQLLSKNRMISMTEEQEKVHRKYCREGATGHSNKMVEDLLCMTPPSYLPHFKNPCWYNDYQLNCLPYFMLIGMDKSGSTDLFGRLSRHPLILSNGKDKETMWWSWLRYGYWLIGSRKRKSFKDYLWYFMKPADQIKNTTDSEGYHYLITGDGTPMDMWDFRGWKHIPQNMNKSEPDILTPHLIRQINPDVKFIIILRNPVERLYSDYYFLKLSEPTSGAFDIAVNASLNILQECIKNNSLRNCLYDEHNHELWDYRARIHLGFYSVYLNEWFSVFPMEQFYILRTEDYSKNMEHYLSQIFDFLGVGQLTTEQMQKHGVLQKDRLYVTKEKSKAAPMSNRTRRILTELYRPFNEKLASMLKNQKYLWTKS